MLKYINTIDGPMRALSLEQVQEADRKHHEKIREMEHGNWPVCPKCERDLAVVKVEHPMITEERNPGTPHILDYPEDAFYVKKYYCPVHDVRPNPNGLPVFTVGAYIDKPH